MTMAEHVRILGFLYIIFNIFELLAAGLVFAVIMGGGFLGTLFFGELAPFTFAALVGGMIALFLLLVAVPGIIGGIGLLRYKSWARILVLALAILSLFNFPLGTLLGIYTLWVLLHQESKPLFT